MTVSSARSAARRIGHRPAAAVLVGPILAATSLVGGTLSIPSGPAAAAPPAATASAASPTASSTALSTWASPEEALQAFRTAVESEGGKGIVGLFGNEYEADLIGGDPAEARQNVAALKRLAAQGMTLSPEGQDRMTIVMGRRGWPMPIPLVKGPAGWSFDVKNGLQEIADRRVGRNELAVIDFCATYVEAQRAYAVDDHGGQGVLEFARRLTSSEGRHDGLYWPVGADGVVSPLGPFAAQAENYLRERKEGEPFHGYYYRVLERQGPHAPGGKYEYVINGHMVAGFALLAWPADYGRSGIMTFQCGQNGRIVQKDLGAKTAELAAAITTYDPDANWQPAEAGAE